jgi:hypothetical protein
MEAIRCYEVVLAKNPEDSRTTSLLVRAREEAGVSG